MRRAHAEGESVVMQTMLMVRLAALLAVSIVHCSARAASEPDVSAPGAEKPKKPKWTVHKDWPFDAKEAKRRQGRTAKELGIPVKVTSTIGMKLVLVPAGEFRMGSPASEKEREDDESPQHRVVITKPFYMGAYEVTQAQYDAVMWKNQSRFKGLDNPVEFTDSHDAVEFCRKLSEKEEIEYRLPTEAEWEYACRAGTATAFYYGDSLSSRQANFDGNYPYGGARKGPHRKKTTAVGSFRANAWGLYDMHGNVCEWCRDWQGEDYYQSSPVKDPRGPDSGVYRVLRGGAWGRNAGYCRSAARLRDYRDYGYSFFGFRVVRAAKPYFSKMGVTAEQPGEKKEAEQPGDKKEKEQDNAALYYRKAYDLWERGQEAEALKLIRAGSTKPRYEPGASAPMGLTQEEEHKLLNTVAGVRELERRYMTVRKDIAYSLYIAAALDAEDKGDAEANGWIIVRFGRHIRGEKRHVRRESEFSYYIRQAGTSIELVGLHRLHEFYTDHERKNDVDNIRELLDTWNAEGWKLENEGSALRLRERKKLEVHGITEEYRLGVYSGRRRDPDESER